MSPFPWLAVGLLVAGSSAAGFEEDFTGSTLRVDYYHVGTASEERLALDRVRVEGHWPGSRTRLIDTTDLGQYLLEVCDRSTNAVLYTRGFGAIFGEWETTSEALDGAWRAIPAAVRLPEPRRPFQLRIRKRAPDQSFRELWSVTIDPASRFVDRAQLAAGEWWTIQESGSAATKVDLVVLGDGYAVTESEKFRADAERLSAALFSTEPFASRRGDFNVRGVVTPAAETGITTPSGPDRADCGGSPQRG